jgi:hypothetical protein
MVAAMNAEDDEEQTERILDEQQKKTDGRQTRIRQFHYENRSIKAFFHVTL